MQLTTPGTKISTLDEVFDFVRCVDQKREVFFNIESKVNPQFNGTTRTPDDFVRFQHASFVRSGYSLGQITVSLSITTVQSFRAELGVVPEFRLAHLDWHEED